MTDDIAPIHMTMEERRAEKAAANGHDAPEAEGYEEPVDELKPDRLLAYDDDGNLYEVDEFLDGDRHTLPGGDAILDEPDDVPAVWGDGSEVLWSEGEAFMIAAPAGVGKTTLAQQIVLGLVGQRSEVLGYRFHGAPRKVLYLAMDRPRQILRSFRRMVAEDDRDILNEQLLVRKGPMPADLAVDPTLLVQLARSVGADVVIVDSLKDAAVKLTDDETGGKVNRAIQHAVALGIDVLVLHHQRKGQNGEKPKKLEDVYGSTWLTAGMGSVVLLWGAAGDAIVEMVHLKQPAEVVGPLKIEHDQARGETTIYRGFDLLRFLNLNPAGVTAQQVAVAMFEKPNPTDNNVRQARRKLAAAVERGIATRKGASEGGAGGTDPARYYSVGGGQ